MIPSEIVRIYTVVAILYAEIWKEAILLDICGDSCEKWSLVSLQVFFTHFWQKGKLKQVAINDIVINISRQSIIVESWGCFNLINM